MNSDTQFLSKYLKPNSLIELIIFIPGTQAVNIRVGMLEEISNDGRTIVLRPHNNKLADQAYGGDIQAKYDIHDIKNVTEILSLDDDETALKQIISRNLADNES